MLTAAVIVIVGLPQGMSVLLQLIAPWSRFVMAQHQIVLQQLIWTSLVTTTGDFVLMGSALALYA